MNWNKLYLLCLLVCSIVTLVFSIVTYSAFVNLNVSYNLLISTWQENPIIGIRAIPSTQRCSALTDLKDTLTLNNTKDLVLNQDVYWTEFPKYEFGGFYDGCDCRDVSYIVSSRYPDVSRTLTTGSCSYNETRAGCIYIDTYTKAQSMSILNNNHRQDARLLSQQLCLLKTKDNSFMDQINRHIANGYQPCNQYGYKVCGKGMNRFCIDKRSSCPITYISIGTNQSSSNNSIKAQAIVGGNDAVYVNIGGYEYNQQLPISVFSVGMGQYVCLDDYRKQTTTKSSQYILQKGSQYNCAANSDPRFTMVYQTDEFNLFESNLHNDLVLRFPRKDRYREVYSKEPYYVKSRNYLQWDTTNQYCIRLGSRIQEKKVKFDSVHNYWLVAMIINIVGLVVCCFFICRHIDHEGFNTDNGFTSKMDLLNYGSKILQLPFIILALSKSNSVIGYFEDLSYEQCSDHLVNQDIKNIYDTLESQSVKGWMAIVWLIVSLLVDVMVTLYKYNKVRQDSKYQQHRLMDKLSMQEQ